MELSCTAPRIFGPVISSLFYDYRTSVGAYPKWQAWMRETFFVSRASLPYGVKVKSWLVASPPEISTGAGDDLVV